MEAFKYLKIGKAPGWSEVYAEMILASGDIWIRVLMELSQRILDGKVMPADWTINVAIPIANVKGKEISWTGMLGRKTTGTFDENCWKGTCEKIEKVVMIDDMQFVFMPDKVTIYVILILRIEEENLAKQKKLYLCFVDLQKAFDWVPSKVVEWAMRKKGIPRALVRAVMSLY